MKNKVKGITLIALVITIIVLLILAGITIATLTGQNGILSNAANSKIETRGASVEEAKNIWKTEQYTNKQTGVGAARTLEEVLQELKAKDLLTESEVTTIKETGEIIIGSRTIVFGTGQLTLVEMYEKAENDGCVNKDGSCTNEEHLHQGDYVNYNPGTEGSYRSIGEKTGMIDYFPESLDEETKNQLFKVDNTIKWRVLGIEGEGSNKQILLISENTIKRQSIDDDANYYLYGAKGHINYKTELNNICAIYGNGQGAQSARSVTIEDINKVCGVTVDDTGVKPEGVDNYGKYGRTISFTDQYASPEDYLAGIKSNFSKTTDAYYYDGNNAKLKTGSNQKLYEMLFKEAYWLASTSVYVDSGGTYFCEGLIGNGMVDIMNYLIDSTGFECHNCAGVRPIVLLEPNISIDTIEKIQI